MVWIYISGSWLESLQNQKSDLQLVFSPAIHSISETNDQTYCNWGNSWSAMEWYTLYCCYRVCSCGVGLDRLRDVLLIFISPCDLLKNLREYWNKSEWIQIEKLYQIAYISFWWLFIYKIEGLEQLCRFPQSSVR